MLTPTWLYGLEGPKEDYEKNVGLSDASREGTGRRPGCRRPKGLD
jgi:hypothetical protein